jgi:hypothetical protein
VIPLTPQDSLNFNNSLELFSSEDIFNLSEHCPLKPPQTKSLAFVIGERILQPLIATAARVLKITLSFPTFPIVSAQELSDSVKDNKQEEIWNLIGIEPEKYNSLLDHLNGQNQERQGKLSEAEKNFSVTREMVLDIDLTISSHEDTLRKSCQSVHQLVYQLKTIVNDLQTMGSNSTYAPSLQNNRVVVLTLPRVIEGMFLEGGYQHRKPKISP